MVILIFFVCGFLKMDSSQEIKICEMIHNRRLVLLLNYVHINIVAVEQFLLDILEPDYIYFSYTTILFYYAAYP